MLSLECSAREGYYAILILTPPPRAATCFLYLTAVLTILETWAGVVGNVTTAGL